MAQHRNATRVSGGVIIGSELPPSPHRHRAFPHCANVEGSRGPRADPARRLAPRQAHRPPVLRVERRFVPRAVLSNDAAAAQTDELSVGRVCEVLVLKSFVMARLGFQSLT